MLNKVIVRPCASKASNASATFVAICRRGFFLSLVTSSSSIFETARIARAMSSLSACLMRPDSTRLHKAYDKLPNTMYLDEGIITSLDEEDEATTIIVTILVFLFASFHLWNYKCVWELVIDVVFIWQHLIYGRSYLFKKS